MTLPQKGEDNMNDWKGMLKRHKNTIYVFTIGFLSGLLAMTFLVANFTDAYNPGWKKRHRRTGMCEKDTEEQQETA